MKLIITIQDQGNLLIQLKEGRKVIDREDLTISRNLDTLLISAIDKLLVRNRIDRLSLKGLEIRGKVSSGTVSGMILKTIRSGLGI